MPRVFVTGANRGIGLEFVRELVARGDRVFAGVRRPDLAFELDELRDAHPDLLSIVELDVADPASIDAAHEAIAAETDRLDVLINNAGTAADSAGVKEAPSICELGELDPDEMDHVLRVNTIGPLLVVQRFRDLLAAAGRAKVVDITSGLGSVSGTVHGGHYAYSASKAGLNIVTRLLAHDLRSAGVIVVALSPGTVKTDMGGPAASLTPQRSVGGMIRIIDSLDMPHSGGLFDWKGNRLQW